MTQHRELDQVLSGYLNVSLANLLASLQVGKQEKCILIWANKQKGQRVKDMFTEVQVGTVKLFEFTSDQVTWRR
jgi:hypothetical protein